MLHIKLTTCANTSCVFIFDGREIGRTPTSPSSVHTLSVPVSLLERREAVQHRPFYMESILVELMDASKQSNLESLASSVGIGGERSKLCEVWLNLDLDLDLGLDSPVQARHHKTSARVCDPHGYVHVELRYAMSATIDHHHHHRPRQRRMQLCELLPPTALQYQHLYASIAVASPDSNTLMGRLLLLPGPLCGEIVLDLREDVEWRPVSMTNAFGDRFPLILQGKLIITDLRVIFLPIQTYVNAQTTTQTEEESIVTLRKTTFQCPLGALQTQRSISTIASSSSSSLILETRDGVVVEFLLRASSQPSSSVITPLPSIWCTRAVETLQALVRQDRAWVLMAKYLSMSMSMSASASASTSTTTPQKPAQPTLDSEYQRLRVAEGGVWRLSSNHNYTLCPSYPHTLCLPGTLQDEEAAASQRSKGRLACLVWQHPHNKAPLCRAAQPKAGVFGYGADVADVDRRACLAIKSAAGGGLPLRIADARPRLNANANALQGKGFESVSALGGPSVAELVFLGIENIHEMRRSLTKLREVLGWGGEASASSSAFGSDAHGQGGDSTGLSTSSAASWLSHVAALLRASACVAESLLLGHPVLTHCSDGWDRTSQISALAQVLLDPYYRTCDGLFALINKEWCAFGHHFEDRCNGPAGHKETSPVFLQFLDCVFQITQQHPTACEFSPALLVLLSQAAASGLFSTFRADCERDREALLEKAATLEGLQPEDVQASCVFSYMSMLLRGSSGVVLLNPYYTPPLPALRQCHYLRPRGGGPHDVVLWRAGLCGCFPPGLGAAGVEGPTAAECAANALRSAATVNAYLNNVGHFNDKWTQLRVSLLQEQTLPRVPSLLEAPILGPGPGCGYGGINTRRPMPPRVSVGQPRHHQRHCGLLVLSWLRARMWSHKTHYPGTIRRTLFVIAFTELKVKYWACELGRRAMKGYLEREVVSHCVEAALDQGLRTEHAQAFLEGRGGEVEGRRSAGETLMGRVRKMAGGAAADAVVSPPVVLVPPVSASATSSFTPEQSPGRTRGDSTHKERDRQKKESVFRELLNFVQGKGGKG